MSDGPCISCALGLYEECGHKPSTVLSFSHSNKSDDDLKDPFSTGRKRAAELHPLDPEADCEWKGKKNCGGGYYPIIGCLNGKQQNLHHGPSKCTLHNCRTDRCTNLHKICSKCHQRWHWLNDANPIVHKPEEATPAELLQNEANWSQPGYSKSIAGATKRSKS